MSPSEDHEAPSDGSEESDYGENSKDSGPKTKILRSSRACITCRRMKTRCEIDEALGSACKLCIRTRRQCIMQDIPRRRKRKTTERVADLEQKINALTALLASKETSTSPTDNGSVPPRPYIDQESPVASGDTLIAEALSRDLLDWKTACSAFDRYKHEMSQYFPFVVFSANLDADTLREQQPLLFFAIVTVGLGRMRSKIDSELCDMLIKDLALRIVYRGERSLELVQTLLVHISFYSKALQMRDLNFNQMTHIASTMAVDLGLGRRPHKKTFARCTDTYQLESLAARRAWLGCYYMATSISMSLRQPAFLRWSVYTEECLDMLSAEPPALPTDVWLCDLIRIQRIAEAASVAFAMDDPGAIITLRDVRTQYQLRGFRQQLDYWRLHARSNLVLRKWFLSYTLAKSIEMADLSVTEAYARHVAACTDLFINEIALHPEHDIDDLRSPLRVPQPAMDQLAVKFKDLHFIPAREEALYACLGAIHECFDSLLACDLAMSCSLPNLFFVRTGYAARALRKLLNICDSQAEFEGRSHIDVQDLKFEEYLNSIIALLAAVHAENSATVPRAFGMVLVQIKTQARESSKLLSTIKLPEEDDPISTLPTGSEPYGPPWLLLEKTHKPSQGDPAATKSLDLAGSLPVQPPPIGAALQPQVYRDSNQWQQNDQDDDFMTGIDVLQWFEQDFALNAGVFDETYDAMSLQPGSAEWQQ